MGTNFLGYCPLCTKEIQPDKQIGPLSVCSCGWTSRIHHIQLEERQAKGTAIKLFILAILIAGSFLHFASWGRDGFEIIRITTAQWLGYASKADLNRKAEICNSQAKYDCVEAAYFELFKKEPLNLKPLGDLGILQTKREKYYQAVLTLGEYFRRQGQDMDVAFHYAQSLAKTGAVEESAKYFRYIIEAKPDVVQHTVLKAYVDLLMKNKQFEQARGVISNYRSRGQQFSYFMENEWQDLNKKLGNRNKS